jgi:hypothetical protein
VGRDSGIHGSADLTLAFICRYGWLGSLQCCSFYGRLI